MDLVLRKRACRRSLVARILAAEAERRRFEQDILAASFAGLAGFRGAGTVLLYVTAFPEEIDTGPMLRTALEAGKRLVVPRVERASRSLRLHEVADLAADLIPGMLGIPEPRREARVVAPEEIDWVLVPGLGFNTEGYRIGRGAGHYDRLLPTLRPEVARWAARLRLPMG